MENLNFSLPMAHWNGDIFVVCIYAVRMLAACREFSFFEEWWILMPGYDIFADFQYCRSYCKYYLKRTRETKTVVWLLR